MKKKFLWQIFLAIYLSRYFFTQFFTLKKTKKTIMDMPFLGSIQYWGCTFIPKGYMACNGQLMAINQYTALFALLGTTYGGNGQTNFALPNLQGRTIVGASNGTGMGVVTGTESVTMLPGHLPIHTHTGGSAKIGVNATTGGSTTPTGTYFGFSGRTVSLYATGNTSNNLGAASTSISVAGGGSPIPIRNPYLGLYCSIATVGLFPSRN